MVLYLLCSSGEEDAILSSLAEDEEHDSGLRPSCQLSSLALPFLEGVLELA
jgi:hypothetical protein